MISGNMFNQPRLVKWTKFRAKRVQLLALREALESTKYLRDAELSRNPCPWGGIHLEC